MEELTTREWAAQKLHGTDAVDIKATTLGTKEVPKERFFKASSVNPLTSNWAGMPININQDIRMSHAILKGRSRDLAKNNCPFKKYLGMARRNIIGPDGIRLQMKVRDIKGKPDKGANKIIQDAWADWGRMENCTVEGKMTWLDSQNFAVDNWNTDGEVFIRTLPGFKNKYRFAMQFLDSMAMPVDLNANLGLGVRIRQGIEIDTWGKPIAYHFTKAPYSNDYSDFSPVFASSLGFNYIRVPADQVIHIFRPQFPGQLRGIPSASAVILTLNMLDGYTEAELVAARAAACKQGFYIPPAGAEINGDVKLGNGDLAKEFEPGIIEQLPPGFDFKEHNSQHPNGNYGIFWKAMMREAANGLEVAFNDFANDLSDVSFSSIRSGTLAERDKWKQDQQFLIEHMNQPVFERWLPIMLLTGVTPLPSSKLSKFNAAEWLPRSWPWVDPRSDAAASISLMEAGLKPPQDILAESGKDIEEVQEMFEQAKPLLELIAKLFPTKSMVDMKALAEGKTETGNGEDSNGSKQEP